MSTYKEIAIIVNNCHTRWFVGRGSEGFFAVFLKALDVATDGGTILWNLELETCFS